MLTYRYLKKNALGKYCKDCMNYLHNIDLKQGDFLYYHGSHQCEQCGRYRHIVYDIKKGKRHKVWFGTKPVPMD